MSSSEKFLSRWSRRKSEAEQAASSEPVRKDEGSGKDQPEAASVSNAASPTEPPTDFDCSTLPPLESIGAQSDIRAFLAPGVPVEMTRAALRRAWAADPAIRDFVGLAENSWDFNAKVAVHGFDALSPTEIAELAEQFLQGQRPSAEAERPGSHDHGPAQVPMEAKESQPPNDSPESRQPRVAVGEAIPLHGEVMAEPAMLHRNDTAPVMPKEAPNHENHAQAGTRHHGRALPK